MHIAAGRLPNAGAVAWLGQTVEVVAGLRLSEAAARRTVQIRFSQAVRHAPRVPVAPTPAEEAALAQAVAAGFSVAGWSLDQLARATLLAALPDGDGEALVATVDQLVAAADLHELIAVYQALAVLPRPERWAARAAEGVRSNMRAVFAAVACANPYPAAHLDEDAWNQLVLKCLFVGEPLYRVVGLDQRANPRLTTMLCDYAAERWAAKRPVPPGLWRCVGRCADGRAVSALQRAAASTRAVEQQAAILALATCSHPDAEALRRTLPAPTVTQWPVIETAEAGR